MHTLDTTPEGHDRGLAILPDFLPWLRESTGFRGMLRLTTPDRSRALVITLWADEKALHDSAESGSRLGALAAEAAGSERVALEDYEIIFLDCDLTPQDGSA
jgi:hypothetical protein